MERAGCSLSTLRGVRLTDAAGKLLAKITGSGLWYSDLSMATDVYVQFLSICPANHRLPWAVSLDLGDGLVVRANLPATFFMPCQDGSSEIEADGIVEAQGPAPSPGGTCTASQFVLGTARSGYTNSVLFYRHAYLDQPLRNAGGACALGVPTMIGVAPAGGPFQAVAVGNPGNAVCQGTVCRYVAPPSYQIRAGQSLTLSFGDSWFNSPTDANGTPIATEPPCFESIKGVTQLEVPLSLGAFTIDMTASTPESGASIPWREVCSAPVSMAITVEPR